MRHDIESSFIRILGDIMAQQKMVLSRLAAHPKFFRSFENAGGTPDLFCIPFEQDDLLAIFAAINYAHQKGGNSCFAISSAKRLLIHVGCWSGADNFGGGSLWTAKRLCGLFDMAYPSKVLIEMETKRLVELVGRYDSAREHLRLAGEALAETVDDLRAVRRQTGCRECDHFEQSRIDRATRTINHEADSTSKDQRQAAPEAGSLERDHPAEDRRRRSLRAPGVGNLHAVRV